MNDPDPSYDLQAHVQQQIQQTAESWAIQKRDRVRAVRTFCHFDLLWHFLQAFLIHFLGILSYDIIAYYHMISYASLHYLLSALSDAVWKHQTWHSFASKVWHGAGPTLALGDLVVTKRHGKEGGIFRLDPTQDATFKNPEASRAEHKSREKLKQMKWIFVHLWSQFILILQ